MSPKAILAGGSGLLGRALARKLLKLGWDVVILTRVPQVETTGREIAWNGETGGAWSAELEGAAALVNFAGRSINCVFTLENSHEIMDSRLKAVRALGKAMIKCKKKAGLPAAVVGAFVGGEQGAKFLLIDGPGLWLNAIAYAGTFDGALDQAGVL